MKNKTSFKGTSLVTLIFITLLPIVIVGYKVRLEHKLIDAREAIVSPLAISPVLASGAYKEPEYAGASAEKRAVEIIKTAWRKDWKVGVELARCESGFSEDIVNSIHAVGYFQIYNHGWSDKDMQNGVANANYAYTLYKEQGLQPWVSSKSCWEKKI